MDEQQWQDECFAEITRLATEWRAKWPNSCPHCGGWGGFHVSNYPHAPDDFDICEGLSNSTIHYCHRCGQDGLNEDGEGPCRHCGWNYDDGCPGEN